MAYMTTLITDLCMTCIVNKNWNRDVWKLFFDVPESRLDLFRVSDIAFERNKIFMSDINFSSGKSDYLRIKITQSTDIRLRSSPGIHAPLGSSLSYTPYHFVPEAPVRWSLLGFIICSINLNMAFSKSCWISGSTKVNFSSRSRIWPFHDLCIAVVNFHPVWSGTIRFWADLILIECVESHDGTSR